MRSTKGITIVALVITIIVMLILVAVTVNMAINGGLFEYAGKAVGEMKNAIDLEEQLADGKIEIDGVWYASIDDYLDNNPISPGTYASNTFEYEDSNGATAYIPAGFTVSGLVSENTVAGGLVIYEIPSGTSTESWTASEWAEAETKYNQFVWIPVTYTKTGSDTDGNGYDDGFDAVFYRSAWSNNARTTGLSTSYTEPYASGYSEEETEYNNMVASVYKYGGFYIGRYEAGSTTARTDTANGTTEMVVKRDAYPYTYVGWGLTMSDYTSDVVDTSGYNQGSGALALSKKLYEGNTEVTSTLCYGIQWDAMLDFVKSETNNVTSSASWGNYYDNLWTINRATAKWTTDPSSDTTWTTIGENAKTKASESGILLTTGASDSFAAKNIYDIAGNVWEWTNEASSSTDRVTRGGNGSNSGGGFYHSASSCFVGSSYSCANYVGFRAALYIN